MDGERVGDRVVEESAASLARIRRASRVAEIRRGSHEAEVAELLLVARAQAHAFGSAAVAGVRQSWLEPDADATAALVDLISALEDVTSAAAALQARAVVELDRNRRAQEAEVGTKADQRGRGVAAEVALAARTSLVRGRTLMGFSKALCLEMPHTLHALATGRLSPWRSMLLVKESACLPREGRARLDNDLCANPEVLAGLGDRQVGNIARGWCARENAAAVVERRSRAEAERRVTLRPAPDTMAYLTALVPAAQGVAAFAALSKHADSARSSGDPRARGQVMADALIAGVTGQHEGTAPPVLVNLVMTDAALFHGDAEPAEVPGYGPVPAAVARELVGDAGRGAGAWVRRLYRAPDSGSLVAMDSRRRKVPKGLREFIDLRDASTCRVPWCDAPARHSDHVVPWAAGGPSSATDLQSTCEGHNYAKQSLGWAMRPHSEDRGVLQRHTVTTRTPSGHRYVSAAPPLPGGDVGAGTGRERARRLRDPFRSAAVEIDAREDPSPGEFALAEVLAGWAA